MLPQLAVQVACAQDAGDAEGEQVGGTIEGLGCPVAPVGVRGTPTLMVGLLGLIHVERCHYLSRRGELERLCTYTADELDLLELYTESQFNIGEDEFDGEHHQYYGLSLRLVSELARSHADHSAPSGIRRTDRWQRLLDALETEKPPGWTRFGHRLLNVDVEGQRRLSSLFAKGFVSVERDPDKFFTSGLTFGARARLNTIALAVGAPVDDTQFQQNLRYAAESAFEQGNADSILLLYSFVPRTGEPYDFIGTFNRRRAVTGT